MGERDGGRLAPPGWSVPKVFLVLVLVFFIHTLTWIRPQWFWDIPVWKSNSIYWTASLYSKNFKGHLMKSISRMWVGMYSVLLVLWLKKCLSTNKYSKNCLELQCYVWCFLLSRLRVGRIRGLAVQYHPSCPHVSSLPTVCVCVNELVNVQQRSLQKFIASICSFQLLRVFLACDPIKQFILVNLQTDLSYDPFHP